MSQSDVKDAVRERYSQAAQRVSKGNGFFGGGSPTGLLPHTSATGRSVASLASGCCCSRSAVHWPTTAGHSALLKVPRNKMPKVLRLAIFRVDGSLLRGATTEATER